ncbi:unnamed protein product [Pieris macdunnoughi]|uniref:Receptor expression-enhancing protein n=1 Tax=Pieris macdunnoughi TaxID=345717 RepID=A0A821XYY9_9NEOP|nr:unnamed protein product [Pieris macdunnoughi]
METKARYRDDNPVLSLSLGVTSVRHIVTQLEARYARVAGNALEKSLVKYEGNSEAYEYYDLPLALSRGQVLNILFSNVGVALERCIPSVTFANFGLLSLVTGLLAPKMLSYLVVYPFCRLVFGTLYPAYASYKAVRTKNLKEYVKWMMYWIVFALFTCTETFTDVFLSWFPFYYEVKIVLVLWLLSPATKGSSILYRKFVHPALCRREQEIDEYIAKAKDQGYHTVLNLGTKGVNYATTVIMQTAIKGGGGLVQQLRKSYSLSDLTECEPREEHAADEVDDVLTEPRLIRRAVKSAYAARRSASESNSRQPLYFPEVDVDVRPRPRLEEPDFSHIKSTEDISSGYSSADNSTSLTRTASVGASARSRARTTRTTVTTIKRPQAAEDKEVIVEELLEDDFDNTMPPLETLSSPLYLSHTVPPFIYQYVGDQVKIIQVLGNYPLSSNNETNKVRTERVETDFDKNEVELKKLEETKINNNSKEDKSPIDKQYTLSNDMNVKESDVTLPNEKLMDEDIQEEFIDTESRTVNDDSVDSDDEASFGTPEPTPKSVKKLSKGKYGKSKAPLPPKENEKAVLTNTELDNSEIQDLQNFETTEILDSKLILNDSLNVDSNRRSKSKSPARGSGSNLGFGKLLQFPSKLAFWAKESEHGSKEIDKENIIQDIKEKSDELQKLIEAKLESHPEYKFIPLNDDVTLSKSTDV